jgi:hypothetical protein
MCLRERERERERELNKANGSGALTAVCVLNTLLLHVGCALALGIPIMAQLIEPLPMVL